ncbi:2OG-Fe(II) oxygenase [Streptomyces thermolineatus]|uniref:2OG-Fe(II) oxygenase n=1 Tax=Streptomyces thermolineatus TaxID=44033 RepID=A0ABP5Z2M9_9ACTN
MADTSETAQCSAVGTEAIWRLPVTVCCLPRFLPEERADALLQRAVDCAADTFSASTVFEGDVVPSVRRSRTRNDFEAPELVAAIREVLEPVEHVLGVSCRDTEPGYGLNVHNDGDFYRPHQDTDGVEFQPGRVLTFVYYLHRRPRPFRGGSLRVFDISLPVHRGEAARWEDRGWRDWEPEHNSIVFFRPTAWHEVRPVSCPSRRHEDSRFAVNGWFYRTTAGP